MLLNLFQSSVVVDRKPKFAFLGIYLDIPIDVTLSTYSYFLEDDALTHIPHFSYYESQRMFLILYEMIKKFRCSQISNAFYSQ